MSDAVPTTGSDSNYGLDRQVWILVRKAKYHNRKEKQGVVSDFYMLPFVTKVETKNNPETDSSDRAGTRTKSTVITGYDAYVSFDFRHDYYGEIHDEIMSIPEMHKVGPDANVEVLVIFSLLNPKFDGDNGLATDADGFKCFRYFGPLESPDSGPAGDDTKVTNNKATIRPFSEPIAFPWTEDGDVLKPLIKDFIALNHPIDTGNWDNSRPGKYK